MSFRVRCKIQDNEQKERKKTGVVRDDGRGMGVDLPGNASCRERTGTPIELLYSQPPVCDKILVGVTVDERNCAQQRILSTAGRCKVESGRRVL